MLIVSILRESHSPLRMKCIFFLVPNTAPSYIRLSNLHLAEVKVQWNPLSQYYANGRLLGYRVYFREYNSYYHYYSYWTRSVNTSSANVTMVILRDLKQATTYQIAVAAFTSKGEGPRSYWMSITTGSAMFEADTNLKKSDLYYLSKPLVSGHTLFNRQLPKSLK